MLRGEGGAERGHGIVEAPLMQGDGIHITLGKDGSSGLAALGDIQGKHIPALIIHRSIR